MPRPTRTRSPAVRGACLTRLARPGRDPADIASKLHGLSGKEFDQAYVRAMVDEHHKVLDTIDNTLIPAADNPQLKVQLQNERSAMAKQLDQLKKLNETLIAGTR